MAVSHYDLLKSQCNYLLTKSLAYLPRIRQTPADATNTRYISHYHKMLADSVVTVAGICNCRWRCFFGMPPQCRWRISVGVKARVVNQKKVDVTASRSDRSGCPGML